MFVFGRVICQSFFLAQIYFCFIKIKIKLGILKVFDIAATRGDG
jgi:hypothetical protein